MKTRCSWKFSPCCLTTRKTTPTIHWCPSTTKWATMKRNRQKRWWLPLSSKTYLPVMTRWDKEPLRCRGIDDSKPIERARETSEESRTSTIRGTCPRPSKNRVTDSTAVKVTKVWSPANSEADAQILAAMRTRLRRGARVGRDRTCSSSTTLWAIGPTRTTRKVRVGVRIAPARRADQKTKVRKLASLTTATWLSIRGMTSAIWRDYSNSISKMKLCRWSTWTMWAWAEMRWAELRASTR